MKKRIICLIFTFVLLLSIFPLGIFAEGSEYAEEDVPEDVDLSKTTIEYDFENIFEGAYNVEDYRPNSSLQGIELIALTEFVTPEGNTEVYLYVYNPRRITYYERDTNYVTLSFEQDSALFNNYHKYKLERIGTADMFYQKSTSTETNASLMKFKIADFSFPKGAHLRAYGVSEIELQLKNSFNAKSYPISKSFIFTTLEDGSCDVMTNSSETILIDDVGHTFYRVQTEFSEYTSDIRSVYFAVKKSYLHRYDEMDSIKICWEENQLQPILLLDDEEVLNDFKAVIGKDTIGDFKYSFGTSLDAGFGSTLFSIGYMGSDFDYAFNPSKLPNRFYAGTEYFFNAFLENTLWSAHFHNTFLDLDSGFDGEAYKRELTKLYLVASCYYDYEEGSTRVLGEQILKEADTYDGNYDGNYADELFTSKSGKLYQTFKVGEKNSLGSYSISTNYLAFILLDSKLKTKAEGVIDYEYLEQVYPDVLRWSDETVSSLLLIDEYDVGNFRSFVEEHSDDSYIYILRYSITETKKAEASVFGDKQIDSLFPAECYVCNGALVDTVLVNDFDVIQLGFNNIESGYRIVPVGMTPTDSVVDITLCPKPDIPTKDSNWWDDFMDTALTIAKTIVFVSLAVVLLLVSLIVISIIERKRGKKNEKKNI